MNIQMNWDASDMASMVDQLSNVPESATWRGATVIERTLDTGIVFTDDGARVGFTSGNLLRNRTHWENTKLGMRVWLTERGGISAHPPSVFSPREQYDAMMREQVRTLAAKVDADAAMEIDKQLRPVDHGERWQDD